MKAKKCDRCGVLYEIETESTIKLSRVFPGSYRNNKGYDLCPECSKKLKAWLKEGENEKK